MHLILTFIFMYDSCCKSHELLVFCKNRTKTGIFSPLTFWLALMGLFFGSACLQNATCPKVICFLWGGGGGV